MVEEDDGWGRGMARGTTKPAARVDGASGRRERAAREGGASGRSGGVRKGRYWGDFPPEPPWGGWVTGRWPKGRVVVPVKAGWCR